MYETRIAMKRFFDRLAVTIFAALIMCLVWLLVIVFKDIPLSVWVTVGTRFGIAALVCIGIWAVARSSTVFDEWAQESKSDREGQELTNKVTHSNTTGDRS